MTLRPLDGVESKKHSPEVAEISARRARDLGLIGCSVCGLACAFDAQQPLNRCGRCNSILHSRKPDSLSRAWIFFFTALVAYVPANLFPVMYTSTLGRGSESTIVGGIVDFWKSGAWDIATIIFIASVAVPAIKFLVLALLLYTSQQGSVWANRQRTRLYRLIELIGYWSMLDIAVVAIVCGLVQFHGFGTAEPRVGIVFFGAMVLLTMFSTMSFDPRLIWDGEAKIANT